MSLPFSRYVPRFFLIGSTLIILALIATLFVLLPKVKLSRAAEASTCQAYGSLTMGKYWLNNNLWGQSSGSGWQCLWDNSLSGSTINLGYLLELDRSIQCRQVIYQCSFGMALGLEIIEYGSADTALRE